MIWVVLSSDVFTEMWQARLWRDSDFLTVFVEKHSTAMILCFSSRSACIGITLLVLLSTIVALIAIFYAKFPNETFYFDAYFGHQNKRHQVKTIGSISLSKYPRQRSSYFDYSTSECGKLRRISESGECGTDSFLITVADTAVGKFMGTMN